MDQPLTLLNLAGATLVPTDFSNSVLVIIDAQLEYLNGALPLVGIGDAIIETKKLLDAARRQRLPVMHVVHHSAVGSRLFDPNGPMSSIISDLAPLPGEQVIAKTMPNAFLRTDLLKQISATGRRELILCGFMTHNCVGATARAAVDLGLAVTIVARATATRDLANPAGGRIPAETVQTVALTVLWDRYALVVSSVTDLDPVEAEE